MQTFTLVLLAIIGVSALYGGYKGFKRGFGKQVVRTLTVVASVFISLYLTKLLSGAAMVWLGTSSKDMLLMIAEKLPLGAFAGLLDYLTPETLNYILAIIFALVIAPLCFLICFLVIKLVMLIPHALLAGIAGFSDRRNNGLTRFLGFLLGVLQGVAVAALIIFPVAGALSSAQEVIATVKEENPESEDTERISAFYDDVLKEYAEDPVITVVSKFGAKQLYESLAVVTVGDTEYNMIETIGEPTVKIGVGINKLWGWDWKKPTPENEDAIRAMIDALDDSDYATALITEVFTCASTAYADGAIPIGAESPLSDVLDAAFETIGNVTEDSLKRDLDTLTEVYFILAREDVIYALEFGDSEQVRVALTRDYIDTDGTKTTVVAKVVSVLNENEHTVPLVTVLTKLSVAALADSMSTGTDIDALYTSVKTGLNSTMAIEKEGKTEEEYKTEVSASLDTVLKDNGIELQPEVVDGMADYIYDNYDELKANDTDGDGTISDKEANDIILSYYDAYIAHNGSVSE